MSNLVVPGLPSTSIPTSLADKINYSAFSKSGESSVLIKNIFSNFIPKSFRWMYSPYLQIYKDSSKGPAFL